MDDQPLSRGVGAGSPRQTPAPAALARVVRGTPTAEELAALVGVLFQRARASATATPPAIRCRWRESGLPATGPRTGPGAWRASALPR